MDAFKNAHALLAECERLLPEINQLYRESVQDNELKTTVCIKVKSYLEHLRSALDYCANAIHLSNGSRADARHRNFAKLTGN